MIVVADTSVVNNLCCVGQGDLLRRLFREVVEKLESELTAEERAKGQEMAAELFRPKDYLEAKAERMQKEQAAVAERSLKEEEDGPRSIL